MGAKLVSDGMPANLLADLDHCSSARAILRVPDPNLPGSFRQIFVRFVLEVRDPYPF